MDRFPKITIITPSFNQGVYLEQAIKSVRVQQYPTLEHIIVDGGSTDNSVNILEEYSSRCGWRQLRWISEPDHGQSDALNKGFKMASGEIVGWLNADDLYHPGCFRNVLEGFQRFPAADIIYGDYAWVDAEGRAFQLRRETSFSKFVLLYHHMLYVPTTATFFRRRFIDEGELLDISYHYAMDYEFFVRLAERGYRFQHISRTLADFRSQPASKSNTGAKQQFLEQCDALARYRPWVAHGGRVRSRLLRLARLGAAARRYGEKAVRGYYFNQFKRRTPFVESIKTPL